MFVGHSTGVAALADRAAGQLGLSPDDDAIVATGCASS
jgi:hypothetical protein